jgi:microcystin-dependent protein
MSNPFIGEIRMFGGNFAPLNWAFCDGSLLPISGFIALFNLLGTTYGGDGINTFALPDLRGRVPVHQGQGTGSNYVIGQKGGSEHANITLANLPAHSHALNASTSPATPASGPAGLLGSSASTSFYGSGGASMAMASGAISAAPGGGQPHENMAPTLAVSFIISLFGIFPSQN